MFLYHSFIKIRVVKRQSIVLHAITDETLKKQEDLLKLKSVVSFYSRSNQSWVLRG